MLFSDTSLCITDLCHNSKSCTDDLCACVGQTSASHGTCNKSSYLSSAKVAITTDS